MPRLLLNWKKHKQLCYGAYNQTRQHFGVLICFWFQWMSLSNLFLIKFWKFLDLYLGCGRMTFDFTTHGRWLYFKSALTRPPMPMNKKHECKDHQISLKCWEKPIKRRSNLNSVRLIKKSSFDQHFLYTDIPIYGPSLSKNYLRQFLVTRSERLLVSSATLLWDMKYFNFVNVSIT